jgi:hypothetical protein
MKLTDLVKKIISEDATGNFPASGGGMSPSRSPTAVSPTPTPVDIIKSYENFKKGLEQQKIYAVNKFSEELRVINDVSVSSVVGHFQFSRNNLVSFKILRT